MPVSLPDLCADAGRAPAELSRRDVARGLLTVSAAEALAALPGLRRELVGAGNPLSLAFWEHTSALLGAIAEATATVGDVRAWLEATGSEPTQIVAGGFMWPEEDERGPVAREMHARLVTHLEQLVAGGTVDPDRLLEGDTAALRAYEQEQEAWLYRRLPDGRQPIWAVSDEEDEQFLAAWDRAEADAVAILGELLEPVGPRPTPEADLRAACLRLRDGLVRRVWPYDLLATAGGVDPTALPADDRSLWLTLAAGVVSCEGEPPTRDPDDHEAHAAWFALDHAAWIGAVVPLVRAGPGAPADAATLAHLAATFDFEDDDDLSDSDAVHADWADDGPDDDWLVDLDDDEPVLELGFATVALLWMTLGAVDEEERLTPLGWWGLPEALRQTWAPDD
jgi:hypothetical protein